MHVFFCVSRANEVIKLQNYSRMKEMKQCWEKECERGKPKKMKTMGRSLLSRRFVFQGLG